MIEDAYFVIIEWKVEAMSKIILFRITEMQTQTVKHLAFAQDIGASFPKMHQWPQVIFVLLR